MKRIMIIFMCLLLIGGCFEPEHKLGLEWIEVQSNPIVKSFVGGTLEIDGLIVIGHYSEGYFWPYSNDDTMQEVVTKNDIYGFDNSKSGKQELEVNISGKTAKIIITVIESITKEVKNVNKIFGNSSYTTMIIKEDGSLWGTGYNGNGELGDGTTEDKVSFEKIMEGVKYVYSAYNNTMVIKEDGSLWGTGYNGNGELGDSTNENRISFEKVMEGVKGVQIGNTRTIIIKEDGSLRGSGLIFYDEKSSIFI